MESTNAWFAVAIVAITLFLVLLLIVGAVAYIQTRRDRAVRHQVWPDVESGAESPGSPTNGTHKKASSGSSRQDALKAPPMDLVETLRGLLKEEISKALQHEGISERLARLEHKEEASQGMQFSNVNDRLNRLEKAMSSQPSSPPGPPPPATSKQQALSLPPMDNMQAATLRAAAAAMDSAPGEDPEEDLPPRRAHGRGPAPVFGPTSRQLRLPDPPETSGFNVSQDTALKTSLKTLQRQLHKRDMQTTDLHRQLRQCQEQLWEQTLEARSSSKRLRDLLKDPSKVPAERAQELDRLQREVERISGSLADAKEAEMRWAWVAKRQRAFFMQNERMGQEGMDLVRRHPAGEVFLAPPPVCLEGDDEECRNPPWDVGTSHINPYTIDSWPFEPNVLAAKASAEPNLNRLEEESAGSGSMSSRSEEADADETLDSCDELQLPRPPDVHGPPGAYDVSPPNSPLPEVGLSSQSARSY